MVKMFCDRCGVEVSKLFTIRTPVKKLKDNSCVIVEKGFCKDCNAYIEKELKQFESDMADERVKFYKKFYER